MPDPPLSTSIPLTSVSSVGDTSSLRPPHTYHPTRSADIGSSSRGSSSDLEHLSKESTSRQGTPFSDLPHPDRDDYRDRQAQAVRKRSDEEEDGSVVFFDADAAREDENDMPSDLRPSMEESKSFRQPLLDADKSRHSYDDPVRPTHSRRSSRFHERDHEAEAHKATRKKYTIAAGFLLVSLVSFAVQTETAVYIQHNLHWNKAFCMLYFTHGSWTVLYPIMLLVLRIKKWHQPWPAFWRRHLTLLRQTAQMVQHQTLHVPSHLQKQSPIPYFIRITIIVTCALTVAGGSWYVAVDLTTASDLTAIYNCSAFFAYAFAVPLLGEKLRVSKMLAVGVAIVGVLVVAYGGASTAKHGSKSGGGTGGSHAPDPSEGPPDNRLLGNLVIGVGSVLYGFYEVLYKRVACPPEGTSPGRSVIFANLIGSLIGIFTVLVLWIPLPILHFLGWEIFELPRGEAAWMLIISTLSNATFSGSFLVLISLTSPVLSSVAALLTIFIVALCDEYLPPPLHHPLTSAAIVGGLLIIFAFLLLSWATYVEMDEENKKHADDLVESDDGL